MTVDVQYIQDMSEYELDEDFTQTQFDRWLTVATEIVTNDKEVTYSDAQFDEQVFNQVCHRIELKKGRLGLSSESIGGDYSYSRNTKEAGQSQWTAAYDALKATVLAARNKGAGSQPSYGVQRNDDTMCDSFHLNEPPSRKWIVGHFDSEGALISTYLYSTENTILQHPLLSLFFTYLHLNLQSDGKRSMKLPNGACIGVLSL